MTEDTPPNDERPQDTALADGLRGTPPIAWFETVTDRGVTPRGTQPTSPIVFE